MPEETSSIYKLKTLQSPITEIWCNNSARIVTKYFPFQGPPGNDTVFEVKFNCNGSVSFQSTVSNVFVGIKDPELFLEMA